MLPSSDALEPILRLTSLLTLAGLASCADSRAGAEQSDIELSALANAADTASKYENLQRGTREVLVEGIAAVENQLFLRDGRLLVSGDDGIYELRKSRAGKFVAELRSPEAACSFSGLAELGDAVYAGCYDGKTSHLYGALLDELVFAEVAVIDGVLLANGMASNGDDNLYVSATGQGLIVRLTIDADEPLAVSAQSAWRTNTGGLLPNGLDIYDGFLYWGDFGSVRKLPLGRRGGQPPAAFISQLTFLDDLHVDRNGVLVADYLFNTVHAFDASGKKLSSTPAVFVNPSSVQPARGRLGLGRDDLIVTEKGGNLVSVYRPSPR